MLFKPRISIKNHQLRSCFRAKLDFKWSANGRCYLTTAQWSSLISNQLRNIYSKSDTHVQDTAKQILFAFHLMKNRRKLITQERKLYGLGNSINEILKTKKILSPSVPSCSISCSLQHRRTCHSTAFWWRSRAALGPLTIVGAKPIFIGIVGWSHLDGWRRWEHQDVCTGSILRGVKLRWLHVQCSTSTKTRAHCDSILKGGEKVWIPFV